MTSSGYGRPATGNGQPKGLLALTVVAALVGSVLYAQQERATFRSGADRVRVDVAVQSSGRPVTNLAATDFNLTDDGALQTIVDFSYGRLPIDVTVALDVSNSVTGTLLNDLRQAIDQLQSRLRDEDRLKLMAFNMRVRRLLDYSTRDLATQIDTQTALNGLSGSGSTAIFDTLAVALSSPAPIDRRQLIIVFSDGRDTASISDAADIVTLARSTTPTVTFVGADETMTPEVMALPAYLGNDLAPTRLARPPVSGRPATGGIVSGAYARIAAETGGRIVRIPRGGDADLRRTFGSILDDFRSSYVLYFTPQTSGKAGFHELAVSVKRPGQYEVRARRGYAY